MFNYTLLDSKGIEGSLCLLKVLTVEISAHRVGGEHLQTEGRQKASRERQPGNRPSKGSTEKRRWGNLSQQTGRGKCRHAKGRHRENPGWWVQVRRNS